MQKYVALVSNMVFSRRLAATGLSVTQGCGAAPPGGLHTVLVRFGVDGMLGVFPLLLPFGCLGNTNAWKLSATLCMFTPIGEVRNEWEFTSTPRMLVKLIRPLRSKVPV